MHSQRLFSILRMQLKQLPTMFKKLLDITSRDYEWIEAVNDVEFITLSYTLVLKHFPGNDSRLN